MVNGWCYRYWGRCRGTKNAADHTYTCSQYSSTRSSSGEGSNARFCRDLGLDILDGVAALHLQGDGLASERLDEDLHLTAPGVAFTCGQLFWGGLSARFCKSIVYARRASEHPEKTRSGTHLSSSPRERASMPGHGDDGLAHQIE